MGSLFILLCLSFCYGIVRSSSDHYFPDVGWNPVTPEKCEDGPKGRVPWILYVRQPDYGWKEHTHRANIALAVNKWRGTDAEMRQMELQLEVEITKALLRNATQKIHENDLALFIHALLATKKNPRNFHGIDLVADLLHRVDEMEGHLHPFLVLALCNSYVVDHRHLLKIREHTRHRNTESRQETELKALALKAFACAATLGDPSLDKFGEHMDAAAKCLVAKQRDDGSFGNAYTTALAVQALIANETKHQWNETAAMRYLEVEAEIKVNLIKAYYIEMALNARSVTYIKDLYPEKPTVPGQTGVPTNYYVQYTLMESENPEMFHTITLKVPKKSNFFEVMNKCAKESPKFEFTHYLNEDGDPMVYSVSGIPNDAEENMFWMLCRENDVDHNRHVSNVTSFPFSPVKLIPNADEHITFWYRNSECPKK